MSNEEQKGPEAYSLAQLGAEHLDGVLALENLIFTTPWSKEQYSMLMAAGFCKVFGAFKGDMLVAYASVSVNQPARELEIYNIAVHPDERRQGLAKRLVGLVLEAARALNLERALLEVREGNAAARALYVGLGFSQCGLRRAYYSAPDEDAVLYEYSFL